jgi:hypothetical protein
MLYTRMRGRDGGLSDASPHCYQAGCSRQEQRQWDSEQHLRRESATCGQRLEAIVTGPLREIDAGDAGRDTLPFYGLGVQEDEAFLVSPEELVERNVLDGRGCRSRAIFLGHDGVQGYRHRRHISGLNIRAGATPVEVVDVLDARFWQAPHVQLDLHAALDIRKGGRPAHPRIADRFELEFHALCSLG